MSWFAHTRVRRPSLTKMRGGDLSETEQADIERIRGDVDI